jgi:hypothetical protein
VANTNQTDTDGDGIGDACEAAGGHAIVTARVNGTGSVNGVQVTITYPTGAGLTIANSDVTKTGGMSPPGGLLAVNTVIPGEVRVVGTLDVGVTFAAPNDAYRLNFAYSGTAPVIGNFATTFCKITDAGGVDIPAATCALSLVLGP